MLDCTTDSPSCLQLISSTNALRFIQRAQVAAGAWEGDLLHRTSATWNCLKAAPMMSDGPERLAFAVVVVRFARRVIGAAGDSVTPTELHHALERPSSRRHSNIAIRLIIRQRADATLNLGHIASAVGVTRFTLSRLLVRHSGCTFPTHLHGCRLLDACLRLSCADNLTVKEIAALVGYERTSDLDRHFQDWFRLSPSGFRAPLAIAGRGWPVQFTELTR